LGYVTDVTSAALQTALTGQAARQRACAENLANVDTPGYTPHRIVFEEQLRAALDAGSRESDAESVRAVRPLATTDSPGPLRRDGNGVDVEQEMVNLSESQLQYAALTKLLAHKYQMLKSVATEGAGR
jgi:flagellar basal-body rod protein FlgB